jgi:ornithine decarboxylase
MAPSLLAPTAAYPFSLKDIHALNDYTRDNADSHGASIAKSLIGDALKTRVDAVDHDLCGVGEEDAFFVADLGEVYRQHLRWKKNLARVKPHYGPSCPLCLFPVLPC